jgi:hypothetical protein
MLAWVEPDLDARGVHTGPHIADVEGEDVVGGRLLFRLDVLPRVDVAAVRGGVAAALP